MGKYFTVGELCRSAVAQAYGIDNVPSGEERLNLERLIENVLDPLREMWGSPVEVNSGFRTRQLNELVGGARASQHLSGEAADISAGGKQANRSIFDMLLESGIEFDQLIDEKNFSWLHISYRAGHNRRQVLSL